MYADGLMDAYLYKIKRLYVSRKTVNEVKPGNEVTIYVKRSVKYLRTNSTNLENVATQTNYKN